jgi:hypothetical protein
LAFAACTRTGAFGKGRQVQVGSVTSAVRYVAQTFELAGYRDPRRPDRTHDLNLAFTRLYSAYRNEDPAPQPMIALPVKLFANIAATEGVSDSPMEQAISDLVTVAFFFLLRVGEYTCPSTTKVTRTRQFRLKDVSFWARNAAGRRRRLPFNAPLAALLAADAVTLILSNQKNGLRDAVLHHDTVEGALCPVKAMARRFASARAASGGRQKALICQFGPGKHIVARHIGQVLQRAAIRTTIWMEGFALHRIGSHSIRASGAMQLFLNNVSKAKIKKIGRWKSATWLSYIHSQISAVSEGLSRKMVRPVVYYNIATRTAAGAA